MIRSRHATRARWRKRNEDINLSRVMRLNNYRELRALRNGPFATHEFMSMAGVLCRTDLNPYYERLAYLIREWCADPSIKPSPISAKQMMSLHETFLQCSHCMKEELKIITCIMMKDIHYGIL